MSLETPWQGAAPHGGETIKVIEKMRAAGCVITAAGILRNRVLARGGVVAWSTMDTLRFLRATRGALVDANGREPGDLMAWDVACREMGFACNPAVASAPDHEDAMHEFAGHLVDPNADLSGALAAAMVGGFAAVRVDVDGDGKGDHTIACVERDGDGFKCADPALGDYVTLDANLENAAMRWNGRPHPYRAVGVRAVYLPSA